MLIGFINGTLSLDRTLSHASMSEHYDDGEYLCIHSVVIDQPYRRHHFASQMLINYINYIKRLSSSAATSLTSSSSSSSSTTLSVPISIKALVLVCKLHLMPLYLSVGFRFVCKSDLDYGQDTWYEHDLVLDS